MKRTHHRIWIGLVILTALLLVGCQESTPEQAAVAPTATPGAEPTAVVEPTRDRDFVVIATDAPLPPFTRFDEFGSIEGFNNDIMQNIAAKAGFEYEFVVTPYQGVMDLLATGNSRDFDAVMSTLLIPETPREGVAYSVPYLEIGQVMLVLADEADLTNYNDLRPGTPVGVLKDSSGEQIALEVMQMNEEDLVSSFEKPAEAVQALIDETVRAVIIDSFSAEYFAESFPLQLKIIGGEGRDAWVGSKSYGIAVAANNTDLLNRINDAIAAVQEEGVVERLSVAWLLLDDLSAAEIDPGESRVGTPAGEFVIGLVGELGDMDPAQLTPDFISWELLSNTMSGLYMWDTDNQLLPMLAEGQPQISADKLEYTVQLKPGLFFPDGREFTAEDVRWSVVRASRLGNFQVNSILKDANEDNFADPDAVQVVDSNTVKFILQEPTAYFPSLLATPPFFPISQDCYAETADPTSTCGGLGPYTIDGWDAGDAMRLKANPQWPGRPTPAFENITVRFYTNVDDMQRSLVEFQSIDLAWTGLPYDEFVTLQALDVDGDGTPDFTGWDGPSTFKSYLIFEQQDSAWSNRKVRQAASYALDRAALVEEIFAGSRLPLLSPIPSDVPGHVDALPAEPDVTQVRSLMLEAGYTPSNPLEVEMWFVNDGRYSSAEEQYLNAIASQLAATGVFSVTVNGAPWEQFRVQIAQCGYPAYLLGWPSPGQPVSYLDASSWTDFFVTNTDSTFCSNYQNPEMDRLVTAVREETNPDVRRDLLAQMQALWANDLPTLDITQQPRYALSLNRVDNVRIDALGLMQYQYLTKTGG